MEIMENKKLGRYELLEIIGQGGMGQVYRARDPMLDREVAIKILPSSFKKDREFQQRFLKEAKAAARLNHPNVVSIHDIGEVDEGIYITMSLIHGQSLSQLISSGGMAYHEMRSILSQISSALDYAHKKGLVHRDIKPSNILIGEDGRPYITDFGIAKIQDADNELTREGYVIGTPTYIAPEAWQGNSVDPRADIYSLGVLAFEMATGTPPFHGNLMQMMQQHLHKKPPPLEDLRPDVPTNLSKAVLIALAKKPIDRFNTAGDFVAAAFPDILQKSPTPLVAEPRMPKSKGGPGAWLSRLFKSLFSQPQPSTSTASQKSHQEASDDSDQASQKLEADRTIIVPMSTSAAIPVPPPEEVSPLPDSTMIFRVDSSGDGDPFGEAPVALVVIGAPDPAQVGDRIAFSQFPFTVGRSDSAAFNIRGDLGISRQHIKITNCNDGYRIRDLSTNGVFVNGRRLKQGVEEILMFGDTIALSAETSLRFVADLPWLPDMTGSILDDRYKLKKMLHESMKAATYEAEDNRLPRKLAVKIFSPTLYRLPIYQNEFRRQAEIAAILDHPHICKIIDNGKTEVEVSGSLQLLPYLCMNLMAGGNLTYRLKQKPTPNLDLVLVWVRDLAGALARAHREEVIHGGLKPSCIVFDDQDNPYLTDFASASKQGETSAKVVLGAPAFLAPEQWDGNEASVATDVYSLAALVYLMLTGSRPYEGQSDPEVRRRNYARGLLPAHEEAARNDRQDIPQALSTVLSKAMSVNPDDRYPSIQEFNDAFDQAIQTDSAKASVNPQVFLSYRRESSAGWAVLFARELMEKHGISAFVDTQRRDSARRFPEKLANAVADCDIFICLLAGDTLESAWVREEIRLAFESNKPMIPVFQESYQIKDFPDENYIEAMLSFDGVHLLDRRNIHVDHTISDLADIIHRTVSK
jgi:serine/threonine protein kinase